MKPIAAVGPLSSGARSLLHTRLVEIEGTHDAWTKELIRHHMDMCFFQYIADIRSALEEYRWHVDRAPERHTAHAINKRSAIRMVFDACNITLRLDPAVGGIRKLARKVRVSCEAQIEEIRQTLDRIEAMRQQHYSKNKVLAPTREIDLLEEMPSIIDELEKRLLALYAAAKSPLGLPNLGYGK